MWFGLQFVLIQEIKVRKLRMRGCSKSMAAECLTTITEQWIRDKLHLKHPYLGDVRSLRLPGTYEEKIRHLGIALKNLVRLKTLDLSYNALVSVEGVQHLKMLEKLNLYYNRIHSTEEVRVLSKLPALKELDLRLNPLTRSEPHYRLCLIHAMSSLRKLGKDTERKVAIMQFPSDCLPQQSSLALHLETEQRSRNQRLTSVERLTKMLSHMGVPDDIVLNVVAKSSVGQSNTLSYTFHEHVEPQPYLKQETEEGTSKNISESIKTSSQEMGKSILRFNKTKYMTEKPRVSFGPIVEKKCRSVTGRPKHKDNARQMRLQAKGHFTPNPSENPQRCSSPLHTIQPPSPPSSGLLLSDPSNPILHPARISYSGINKTTGGAAASPQKANKQKRGSYRKPLEMLLNLVDKHWAGERSLHQNNNFLSQAVQILSMMEDDLSVQEAEVTTLRWDMAALRHGAEQTEEEHQVEVLGLSSQVEEAHGAVGKLNEQLRVVLEENVGLQKQLIKLEQQYLKSLMKVSPITQIKEAQTEVEELRREIEGLREKVQEAENVKELTNMLQESHR
ncbi:Centrosomal protein [Merluccius polli]|uniref:Centrosomal protein n=1 Tax=Merluccius polli TaxID=89951 RepID=A0AA47M6N1_MERPO|nr:Centrosomal protein [Merluccius polli]